MMWADIYYLYNKQKFKLEEQDRHIVIVAPHNII